MFKIAATIKKNLSVKAKFVNIDNIVFRMHYRITSWLLFAFCGILCLQEYNKNKIRCTHSDPTDSRKQFEHVIETFCFFMSTFTIPRHVNQTGSLGGHPGVGPSDSMDEPLRHKYYQWVPYVLFLQGLSFYVPHYIWRMMEGGRLNGLVKKLDIIKSYDSQVTEKVYEMVKENFKERIKIYKTWLRWLAFSEILNALNLILQVYLTHIFLGYKFLDLGTLVYEHYGNEQYSPLDLVFPKVAKCTFEKYGPAGSLQRHDAVCVLSLNIVNEKIYLTLWYWYIILAVATALSLLYRILSYALYKTKINFNVNILMWELSMTKKPPHSVLQVLVSSLSYSEWYFLQCLATNLDGMLAFQLLEHLAKHYKGGNKLLEYKYLQDKVDPTEELLSDQFKQGFDFIDK